MNDLKRKVEELILPVLESRNAFLVDVRIRGEGGTKIIQAFVETDGGITIEECGDISRELDRLLRPSGIVDGAYNLEISSPGIDKPLKLLRQYRKNIGRTYSVLYKKDAGAVTLVGTLTDVTDDRLTFSPEKGDPKTLTFSQIIESKEELPW
ncbi:MAG TPA: ribosome maturation factor RimP [Bacteroidota bacterium]|nr:ribosome maturation factor RimP [Bacteroidota bacterium]